MDSWHKFRGKNFRKELAKLDIAELICYGNFLMSEISWLAVQNRLRQGHIDRFLDHASLVIQATIAQKGYNTADSSGLYEYIDQVTKNLTESSVSVREIGLMLGNITEITDTTYTFIELIGFARAFGAKI